MLQTQLAIKIKSIGNQLSAERRLLSDAFNSRNVFFEIKRAILANIRRMEFEIVELEMMINPKKVMLLV
jgi:hypothetical protein